MVYGEDLLRKFVTVVPGWRQKRVTVDILRSIQNDISRYMLTITLINLGVAIATGLALYWIGLEPLDALLWGCVAGVLNFAPYVGPLVAAIAFTLVGLVEFSSLGHALLVPGVFLALHLVEGQFVTPLILGRRMAISPVILLLWLFLWGWMWGIAGLLLAVPMLVCFKIYCSRIEGMKGWAMMMEP
jgi:predicted PurR-regulated permease PerM